AAGDCWCPTIGRWGISSLGSTCGSSVCAPCSRRSGWVTVMTAERALLTLLQFADGLFPTGGFAHSFGLETYVQDGRVRDRHGLEAFVAAHLEGSAGPADAAAVVLAGRLSARADARPWIPLDQPLHATNPVPP